MRGKERKKRRGEERRESQSCSHRITLSSALTMNIDISFRKTTTTVQNSQA